MKKNLKSGHLDLSQVSFLVDGVAHSYEPLKVICVSDQRVLNKKNTRCLRISFKITRGSQNDRNTNAQTKTLIKC